MVGARPEVDLPPVALEMLTPSIRIAFSIRWPTALRRPRRVHGPATTPPRPAAAPPGKALFYDADYGKSESA